MFQILGSECAGNVEQGVVSQMKHTLDLMEAASQGYSKFKVTFKCGYERYGLLLTVVNEVSEERVQGMNLPS